MSKPNRPYTGKYVNYNDVDLMTEVHPTGGNFMWNGMREYLLRKEKRELDAILTEIMQILEYKSYMIDACRSIIDDYDWTHMMSDGMTATNHQHERQRKLLELMEELDETTLLEIYRYYAHKYLDNSLTKTSVPTFTEFMKYASV